MKFDILKNEITENIIKKLIEESVQQKIQKINYTSIEEALEYSFSLLKVNVSLENNENLNIYLNFIEKDKIKESIFCYCSILNKDIENNGIIITELEVNECKKCILLETTIYNNKKEMIYFVDLFQYLRKKVDISLYNNYLTEYLKNNRTILFVGIEIKNSIT